MTAKKILRELEEHKLLLFILLVATILRFYHLGEESFWHDEISTALRSRETIVDMTSRIIEAKKSNNHWQYGFSPLPFYIIHFMMKVSASQYSLLFPGALLSVLSVFLIYYLGTFIGGKKVGIIASILLTLSPFHLYYSQELRQYSYQVFFSLLTYIFASALIKRFSHLRLLGFAVSTILNVLTLATSIFIFLVEVATLLILFISRLLFSKKFRARYLSKKPQVLLLLTGVIGMTLIAKYSSILQSFFKAWTTNTTHTIDGLEFTAESILTWFNLWGDPQPVVFLAYLILLFVGVLRLASKNIWILFMFVSIFLGPFLYLYYFGSPHHFDLRHVIFALPLLILLISLGVDFIFEELKNRFNIKGKKRAFFISGALLLLLITIVPDILHFYENRNLNQYSYITGKYRFYGMRDYFREMTKVVEENLRGDDLVLVDQNMNVAGFEYYYSGDNNFTTYMFGKKPLFLDNLDAPGRGVFICHLCKMESIQEIEKPALIFDNIEEAPPKFQLMKITPKENLVFVADVDNYENSIGWKTRTQYHNQFANQLSINSYFDGFGHIIDNQKMVTNKSESQLSYDVSAVDALYDLYVNIQEWEDPSQLTVEINNRVVDEEWMPGGHWKGGRTKEYFLKNNYLNKGDNSITFINNVDKEISINYFFLIPSE